MLLKHDNRDCYSVNREENICSLINGLRMTGNDIPVFKNNIPDLRSNISDLGSIISHLRSNIPDFRRHISVLVAIFRIWEAIFGICGGIFRTWEPYFGLRETNFIPEILFWYQVMNVIDCHCR